MNNGDQSLDDTNAYIWHLFYRSKVRVEYFSLLSNYYEKIGSWIGWSIILFPILQAIIIIYSNSIMSPDFTMWATIAIGLICTLLGFFVNFGKIVEKSSTSSHSQITWKRIHTDYETLIFSYDSNEEKQNKIQKIQEKTNYIEAEEITAIKTTNKKCLDNAESIAKKYVTEFKGSFNF